MTRSDVQPPKLMLMAEPPAQQAHGNRVAALAKISKLLGGGGAADSSAAARRQEAERKQAAVTGQSRGAVRRLPQPPPRQAARGMGSDACAVMRVHCSVQLLTAARTGTGGAPPNTDHPSKE